jgi:hypothetical protein
MSLFSFVWSFSFSATRIVSDILSRLKNQAVVGTVA